MSRRAAVSLTTGLEDPETGDRRPPRRRRRGRARTADAHVPHEGSRPVRRRGHRGRHRLRRLSEPPRPHGPLRGGRRPAPRVPALLQRQALDPAALVPNAELGGTVQLWEWIGDDDPTTFSY